MNVSPVDERDITQIINNLTFRVWLPRHPDASSISVFEVTGAAFTEVEDWARANGEFGYAIALIRMIPDGVECMWLRGSDSGAETFVRERDE